MRKNEGEQVIAAFRDQFKDPARRRRRRGPLPRQARAASREPEAKRKIIGAEFIRVFEEEAAKLGDAKLPRPGHAVLRRHRVRRRHRRGDDQVPPQRRRPARRPRVRARRAAARAVQGRGPRRRRRARPARAPRLAPAVPGPRPGDPHRRRRGDQGAPRPPARRRLHPPGRDPQRRPLPRAVAVLLRAARRPHRRRPGRRAHLRLRRRHPRGHQRRRDDRRLGAPARTTCSSRSPSRMINELREVNRVVLDITSQAARHDRVGVAAAPAGRRRARPRETPAP